MSLCDVTFTNFNFKSIAKTNAFKEMIKVKRFFDGIYDHNSNYYLVDACISSFKKDSPKYLEC